jgi:hypothetical protein
MLLAVLPEDKWSRDAALMITGWLLATIVAIVLLLTVIRWMFV